MDLCWSLIWTSPINFMVKLWLDTTVSWAISYNYSWLLQVLVVPTSPPNQFGCFLVLYFGTTKKTRKSHHMKFHPWWIIQPKIHGGPWYLDEGSWKCCSCSKERRAQSGVPALLIEKSYLEITDLFNNLRGLKDWNQLGRLVTKFAAHPGAISLRKWDIPYPNFGSPSFHPMTNLKFTTERFLRNVLFSFGSETYHRVSNNNPGKMCPQNLCTP